MSILDIFGKNDWILKGVRQGDWEITNVDPILPYYKTKSTDRCWYEIWFSPSRQKCKLKMGGYKPKQHSAYPEAVQTMNEWMLNRYQTKK
jgi:hypothetical protein